MSQRPFPKPPPAEPLPDEVWFKRTDRSEVGREPFFCGRDDEYGVFQSAVESLREGNVGGGTMIFQGAPGAGKSALMLECKEAVRRHSTPEEPWVAVSIHPGTLESPVGVVMDLIDAANKESERLSKAFADATARRFNKLLELGTRLYAELSERGVGIAGFSVGAKSEADRNTDVTLTAARVFRNSVPLLDKFHLAVFVDEAQNMPVVDMTHQVLDCIHRDTLGIPVVAAFFGLSDTQQVLRECGLSRFAANRVVNLEPLSTEDATESFKRMLDVYFSGDEKEKAHWASALAKLSQGWPQHVNRIGVAAGQVIRANDGQLKRQLLAQVLEDGTEQKNDYYAERLAAGTSPPWVYKQLAWKAKKKQGSLAGILTDEEVDRLSESARKRRGETIDEFLTNALHAGLLAPVKRLPYHYQFPIPSFSDYLRSLPVEPPNAA